MKKDYFSIFFIVTLLTLLFINDFIVLFNLIVLSLIIAFITNLIIDWWVKL